MEADMDVKRFLMEEMHDPWRRLSHDRLKKAVGIGDFMLGEGRLNPDPSHTLQVMCERFVSAGLPLDRCVTIVGLLHAQRTASVRMWESDKGTSDFSYPYAPGPRSLYQASPSALAHKQRCWVGFNPQEVAEDTFGVVAELKQAGMTGYICAPVFLVNGMQNVFTFATRSPGGFSAHDIAFLRATFPAIAACQEILVVHRILKEVTRMYVGEEPHRRILAGDVHRGDVTRIKSAILFADMRDFTSLTAAMSAEDATALLNDYYDCVVPAIEANEGEVLKFMGDGVLAIFRAEHDGGGASRRALQAAQDGLQDVAKRGPQGQPAFEVGYALHFGEVAYGNVGSGERLDYTVIGRDVNLASRLAGLCGKLEKTVLVSRDFRNKLGQAEFVSCGEHPIKGLAVSEEVFALRSS